MLQHAQIVMQHPHISPNIALPYSFCTDCQRFLDPAYVRILENNFVRNHLKGELCGNPRKKAKDLVQEAQVRVSWFPEALANTHTHMHASHVTLTSTVRQSVTNCVHNWHVIYTQ